MDRRQWLHRLALCSSGLFLEFPTVSTAAAILSARSRIPYRLSAADIQLLDDLERSGFLFFWECGNAQTGLVKDRSYAEGNDARPVASIAATGFGLSTLCIAHTRGWAPKAEIKERVRTTLKFLRDTLPNVHGFYYHFVHWQTGEREWRCELSSIDTALLLAGVLTCRQYFNNDREIVRCATDIYDRVDWRWMAQGEQTLLHGWKPESGFLKSRWSAFCEHMILYLLALGAKDKGLSPECWHAWQRPYIEYKGLRYISDTHAPLFIHQYSHAWIDFRNRKDRYADYFENSIKATQAHRQFCIDLAGEFPNFNERLWGITASDSQKGYVAWGGPPRMGRLDGTLVPCAAAGSLPFLPGECLDCLRTMRNRFGTRVWRRYGYVDAFNPASQWYNPDVIGIDVGISVLMAENLRTGMVWKYFMRNREIQRAMKLAGF